MQVSLSEKRRSFAVNGKPFFYLADTVWSAFTNASMQEWAEYLEYRKMQGFNVLQINILRQWDASESDIAIEPFGLDPNGYYDYHKLNEDYFERADEMLGMAVEQGFVPALVLLWCNYVPDTWASMFQKDNKMPLDCVEPYVSYVVKRFSKFNPIFLVSGDTDFPNETANAYYMKALETACSVSPSSLKTLHIQGRLREIPDSLEQHEGIDFYMYQSGHNSQYQSTAYEIAQHFYKKSWIRPVLNGEPCYEQISYSRNVYGRYSRFDVRKAAWQSLLAGGGAGVTYGAHGIWSWHKKGKRFGIVEGEGFDQPYDWRDALRFEGAWDYSFIKYIFENYNLTGLQPAEILLNPSPEIRAAVSDDTIVIYVPVNTRLRLNLDLQKYTCTTIDLEHRRFAATEMSANGNQTTIHMHRFESDVVLIGEKN
ncbi:apiosidase-like domain-containing protein [Paenibacillus sp. HW567]|uniref:apiosidase-like domain-containing protein n=1 Tax=Paenibacillus sp. HW567 TaxID=1034769 RepID=UPI00037D8A46|nr:DUF4038 domain-containing protein [Paenibacillus sp. HW567]